jgi:hypothetical protein
MSRRPAQLIRLVAGLSVAMVIACTGAGQESDQGVVSDAIQPDTRVAGDARVGADGLVGLDAARDLDARTDPDGHTLPDAAPNPDARAVPNAAPNPDARAIADAAPMPDTGTLPDAGRNADALSDPDARREADLGPPPAPDECGASDLNAGALADGTFRVSGRTSGAENLYAGSCQGAQAPERLYRFVAPESNTWLFYTQSVQEDMLGFGAALYVRSDCDDPASELPGACAPMLEVVAVELQRDQSVYVFVDGNRDFQGDFVLRARPRRPAPIGGACEPFWGELSECVDGAVCADLDHDFDFECVQSIIPAGDACGWEIRNPFAQCAEGTVCEVDEADPNGVARCLVLTIIDEGSACRPGDHLAVCAAGTVCRAHREEDGAGRCIVPHAPELTAVEAFYDLERFELAFRATGSDADHDIHGLEMRLFDADGVEFSEVGYDPWDPPPPDYAPFDTIEHDGAGFVATARHPFRFDVVPVRGQFLVEDAVFLRSLVVESTFLPVPVAGAGEACDVAAAFVHCAPPLVCDGLGARPVDGACVAVDDACDPAFGATPLVDEGDGESHAATATLVAAEDHTAASCSADGAPDVAFGFTAPVEGLYVLEVGSEDPAASFGVFVRAHCAAEDHRQELDCHASWLLPDNTPLRLAGGQTVGIFVEQMANSPWLGDFAVRVARTHPPVLTAASASVGPADGELLVEMTGSDADEDIVLFTVDIVDPDGQHLLMVFGSPAPFGVDPAGLTRNPDGSITLRQAVPLNGVTPDPAATLSLRFRDRWRLESEAVVLPWPAAPSGPAALQSGALTGQ